MTVLELLTVARLQIEIAWCQGQYERFEGGVRHFCLLGALMPATTPGVLYYGATDVLVDVLGQRKLSAWNDDPCRTKEDVLKLYDRAIRMAEERKI